jgi:glycosyltransferase involved in cell wall biosynthesis
MKLSVMIITYNHERFIAQALESVLAQRVNFDYEIVIGEDSSTDGTRAIVMDFHRRYPERIFPQLRNRNLGAMQNLRETLGACRGQYLALLEGDDYWTNDQKLHKQVDFLDAHPDCALCCHRVRFLDEQSMETYPGVEVFPSFRAGSYSIEDLLKGNFVMTCSTVLRRDLIGPIPGWFSKMKLGDWPLFAFVARHGSIELMDEIMADYRVHAGGIWTAMPQASRVKAGIQMLKALDRHFGFHYADTIREKIARPYLNMAMAAQASGNRTATARHLYSCLRNGGWQFRGSRRTMIALVAYALIGPHYKLFSRSKSTSQS